MPSQKFPGTDCLPAEFYTPFWDVLGCDLVDVINFSNRPNLLAKSMRSTILTLAFKGKDCSNKNDRLYLKNWRPISLLNVDFQNGAKALANHLQNVLHYLINPDQTCNIPCRSIPDNLYLIRDFYEYIFQKQFPIAMIRLDQEKAFDRLSWQFLHRVMKKKKNFGEGFCKLVRLLCTDLNCIVINNGPTSTPIKLTRCARQGCLLSPLLYILVTGTLANLIRQNPGMDGLFLPCLKDQAKISQYADNTTLLLLREYSVR